MFKDHHKGKYEDEIIDVVHIETGTQLDRKYGCLNNIQQAWGRNYFIDWDRDKKNCNVSSLTTWCTVPKESLYVNMMHRVGIPKAYGEIMCRAMIDLLD